MKWGNDGEVRKIKPVATNTSCVQPKCIFSVKLFTNSAVYLQTDFYCPLPFYRFFTSVFSFSFSQCFEV